MNLKQIVLWSVLVDFACLTGYVLYSYGLAWVPMIYANLVNFTIFTDLVIALGLILAWMFADAKERGQSAPWGYALLTLGTGSIGPLIYLIRRERESAVASRVAEVSAAA